MAEERKCKDCGETFSIPEGERLWLEKKGLELPKRCKYCRDKRKAARQVNQII